MAIEFGIPEGAEPPARLWSLPTALEHLADFATDKAGEIGKCVKLSVSCPNLLVSPKVIEALVPAMVQLIRNAVEHGIETPMERLACGKPTTGSIRLAVVPRADAIEVTIADDGAGIAAEAVVDAAIAAGAIDAADRGGDDAMALLFCRGVSLAKRDAFRRGAGLKRAAARLKPIRGTAALRSEPGIGTTATIGVGLDGSGPIIVPGVDVFAEDED